MLKKIGTHFLVGAGLFIVGACLSDFANMELGDFMAIGGMAYAIIVPLLTFIAYNIPAIGNLSSSIKRKKAGEELASLKLLLDQGVLSEEEFEKKASSLKKILLSE